MSWWATVHVTPDRTYTVPRLTAEEAKAWCVQDYQRRLKNVVAGLDWTHDSFGDAHANGSYGLRYRVEKSHEA